MKNSKKLLALALVMSMFLVSCNNDTKKDEPTTKVEETKTDEKKENQGEVKTKITVVEGKDEKVLSEKDIKLKDGETLYDALNNNYEIIVDDTGMLTAIDGKEQDKEKNMFWTYTANGEMVMQGIKEYIVKDGDNIKLILSVYEG